jgi:uncharacterized membrane protein YphA (DoxX/SURF4 family)
MLNTFPNLLTYGFFAPTILRIAVSVALFYLAYHQWQRRVEISHIRSAVFPIVSIIFNGLVGIGLLLGYHLQIASLFAIIGFGIGLWMNRRYSQVVILQNVTVLLLITMCLSLLISGAGAFAMDLPL